MRVKFFESTLDALLFVRRVEFNQPLTIATEYVGNATKAAGGHSLNHLSKTSSLHPTITWRKRSFVNMQLCFGCLHSFYPSSFEDGQCSFGEEVIARFEAIRAIATKLQPTTPTARQHVAELEGEVKRLAKAMKVAIDDKDSEIAQLTAQVRFLGEQMEDLIAERQSNAAALAEAMKRGGGGGGAQQRPGASSPRSGSSNSRRGSAFTFSPTPGMDPRAADALGGSVVASNLLNRFLLASKRMPVLGGGLGTSPRRPSSSHFGGTAITTATTVTGGGASFAHHHRPQTSGGSAAAAAAASASYRYAVSAALYSVLEALVVRTRAGMGVLWIRAPDSDGLAATFTAGRGGRRGARNGGGGVALQSTIGSSRAGGSNSANNKGVIGAPVSSTAPYFIGANSIPGSVASTGIVLNMAAEVPPVTEATFAGGVFGDEGGPIAAGDANDPNVFTPATDHELLTNVCTQHSSLTTPVFTRYGAATRKSIAVLQLFGESPAGTPFTADDERLAEAAAVLVSHIITTHYATLAPQWMVHAFVPTALVNESQYFSDIDQRPETKGADGFGAAAPMFVYRGKFSGTLPPPPAPSAAVPPPPPPPAADEGIGSTFLTQTPGGADTVASGASSAAPNSTKRHVPAPPSAKGKGASAASGAAGRPHNSNKSAPAPPRPVIKMRNLRCDMAEFGTPAEAYSGLRDLSRYLDELEDMKSRGAGGPFFLPASGGGGGVGTVSSSATPAAAGLFPPASSSSPSPSSGIDGGLPNIGGPSVSRRDYLLSARHNPTNAGMVSTTTGAPLTPSTAALSYGGGGGGGPNRPAPTTIHAGAIETLEIDTISRLDALLAEARARR